MIKKIRKIRKLNNLKFLEESQLNIQGYSQSSLENEIKMLKEKIEKDLNAMGWLIVLMIVLPLALIQIGLSPQSAFPVSYLGGGLLYFILVKIINLP